MNLSEFASYLKQQPLERLKKIAPVYQKSILKSLVYKELNSKLRKAK
jgi:hypothetical protein